MIKIIGIPFDGNSSFLKGSSLAPDRIRLMDSDGSANSFCENGKEIIPTKTYTDLGNMAFSAIESKVVYGEIKQKIGEELSPSDKIISLGGDHSISFPIIESYAKIYKGLNVLYLDAHGDLYDNFDNNPYSHASPFARLMETGIVKSLTQVGIRTLNTHQKEQAERFNVKVIEAKDLTLDFIKTLAPPLYLSLDVDVLDPAFAPGISHHEPGGLSTREVLKIIQSIPFPLCGADIVEYNPVRDVHNMTAMVTYKFFKELASNMMN